MGVGQEPSSDTIENTDSVNNPISVSDGLKSDKKSKNKNDKTGIELAGEPWPVASNSNVIFSYLNWNILLISYLLKSLSCH